MSKEYVNEIIRRVNDLMQRNVMADVYMDLTVQDISESLFLFRHIEEIAEIVHLYRSGLIPDDEEEQFRFVEEVTPGEIELLWQYMDWFKSLDKREEQRNQERAIVNGFKSIIQDFESLIVDLVRSRDEGLIKEFHELVSLLEESIKKGKSTIDKSLERQ